MTTKTVCASEERCQRILGAVGFFLFRGVEGNDQLYRQNMQRRRPNECKLKTCRDWADLDGSYLLTLSPNLTKLCQPRGGDCS